MARSETIQLRCPSCGRFLAEVRDFGRMVCRDCGCEILFRSREERRRQPGLEIQDPPALEVTAR